MEIEGLGWFFRQ